MAKTERTAGRRSFYVDQAAADALVKMIDDLHWQTRRPKHELLAAAFEFVVENPDAVRSRLERKSEAAA